MRAEARSLQPGSQSPLGMPRKGDRAPFPGKSLKANAKRTECFSFSVGGCALTPGGCVCVCALLEVVATEHTHSFQGKEAVFPPC